MDINYLNLEWWFYQIYLIIQAIYNFIIIGPEAVSSAVTTAVTSLLYLFLFGLIFSLLYFSGTLSIPAFLALGSLGLLTAFIFDALGISYLFPIAFFGLTSLFLYGSGAMGIPAIISLGALFLVFYLLLKFASIYITLSLIFFGILFYSLYKLWLIRKKEEEEFLSSFVVATDPRLESVEEWQDIMNHIDSDNESQWKLALIDADKILENLLREHGYDGDGVGGRLKSAEMQGGVRSLQDAWEAHKIRNKIAHESGFVLTKRDARKAVELYKRVFEDLGFL